MRETTFRSIRYKGHRLAVHASRNGTSVVIDDMVNKRYCEHELNILVNNLQIGVSQGKALIDAKLQYGQQTKTTKRKVRVVAAAAA